MGDFAQEASDLDLGMDAGLELPIELQDHALVKGDRRVALLAAQALHLADLGVDSRKGRAAREADRRAFARGHAKAMAHRRDRRLAELGGGLGRIKKAYSRAAPHARQGVRQERLVLMLLVDRERKEIGVTLGAAEIGLDARQEEGILAEPVLQKREIEHPQARVPALAREPSLPCKEARQGVGLEGAALAPSEQGLARAGKDEREQRGRQALGFDGHAREFEPVEAVARQGQKIGQVADAWEGRAAGELDGDGSFVQREIEFHGLRRARQIDDA